MLPPGEGVFNVRVTAEYADKSPVHFDFRLTVAFSGDNDVDNDKPEIESVSRNHYREGAGAGVVVATFTVEDDENPLIGHPYAPGMPSITSVVNADPDVTSDDNNDSDTSDGATGYASVFEIERVGTSNTYRIKTKENPLTRTVDETDTYLDHELADELRITVAVSDDAGRSDSRNIDIDILPADEAPEYRADGDPADFTPPTEYAVEQFFEDTGTPARDQGKVAIWIKLYDVWEDEDDKSGNNDRDLDYRATSNVPWITILHGPARWGDIEDGRDGEQGGGDDVTWASGVGTPADVVWGETATEPTDRDDWVVVVQIDRSAANNSQSDVTIDLGPGRTAGGGTFTLTATDEQGRRGTQDIYVSVTDENLPADTTKTVTISGAPREGRYLTADFDETRDPDLAGDTSAQLVVYTWSAQAVDADGNNDGAAVQRQVGVSDRYMPTQQDVGMKITVSVDYYELVPLDTVPAGQRGVLVLADAAQDGGSKSTDRVVSDAQTPGVAHISVRTNDTNNGLTADVYLADGDGIDTTDADPEGTAPVYSWEESVNGRGGWETADPDGDADDDTSDQNLALADGNGKFYRLVITYTDNGGFQERHVSDAIKVGELADAGATPPALVSTGQTQVGGILQVNNVPRGASVQWQRQVDPTPASPGSGDEYWVDISGATGASLSITANHAGATLRAMVTATDDDGNVVDIDVTGAATIPGLPNTAPTKVKDFTLDAQVDDMSDSTQVEGTVDLSTLFRDLNGDRLTFEVTAFSDSGVTDRSTTGDPRNTEFVGGSTDHVVSFKIDGNNGMLTYVTDLESGHDGSGNNGDGLGNWVSFTVRANDGKTAVGDRPTAMVNVRLNVKPSDITATEVTDAGGYTQQEQTFTADTHIADLNVIDENFSGSATAPGHPYGIHTVTVSDDRFGIRHNIGTTDPTEDDDDDGSTWELYIKKGATFDFDAAMDADPDTTGKQVQIKLTITATDGGGKMIEKEDLIIISITNDDNDDAEQPGAGDNVPGLSDNEENDDNDKTDDGSGTDTDDDGGWTPPPPGMSLGGIIEDFVDNMDGFEQDLLEDFLLKIDDGLDMV